MDRGFSATGELTENMVIWQGDEVLKLLQDLVR